MKNRYATLWRVCNGAVAAALVASVFIPTISFAQTGSTNAAPTVETVDLLPTGGSTGNSATLSTPSDSQDRSGIGYSGLATCTGVPDGSGRPVCDFTQLVAEVRTFMNWLFVISIPLAVALFAYAGILYMLGAPAKRTQANGIFKAAGIGFAIMLTAWALVYTIVGWITASGSGVTTFLGK